MKNDLREFQRAYDEAPDINIGAKASLKAALDEKKEDIAEAEKIATAFKNDEAEDIASATRTIKYECENLNNNILNARAEIKNIKNRLTSKKTGLIDITSRNKDKDILKELAQTVIDIKHRRQFPETPLEIVQRLEEELGITLTDGIDLELIKNTSSIVSKDYEDYIIENRNEDINEVENIELDNEDIEILSESKRGIKVIDETEITQPTEIAPEEETDNGAAQRLEAAIQEVSNNEENNLEEYNQMQQEVPQQVEYVEEENEPLDIEEIIEQPVEKEIKEETDQLSINTMFNQQNIDNEEENEDNIVTSQNLEDELDQYLSNLDKQD